MAFNLFNKNGNTESHPEEGKEKAYSSAINKLSGLFGHKNSETVEKKEPEVPQAGGMEETENIFNINFQNEKDSLQMAESQAEPSLESLNFQNDLTDFSTEESEKTQEETTLPQDVSSDVSGAELGDETETSLWEDATQTQQSMASDIGHENVFNDGVSRELEAIDNGSDDFVFHENPSESSSVSFEQSQNNKVADSVFGTEENLVVDETPKSVDEDSSLLDPNHLSVAENKNHEEISEELNLPFDSQGENLTLDEAVDENTKKEEEVNLSDSFLSENLVDNDETSLFPEGEDNLSPESFLDDPKEEEMPVDEFQLAEHLPSVEDKTVKEEKDVFHGEDLYATDPSPFQESSAEDHEALSSPSEDKTDVLGEQKFSDEKNIETNDNTLDQKLFADHDENAPLAENDEGEQASLDHEPVAMDHINEETTTEEKNPFAENIVPVMAVDDGDRYGVYQDPLSIVPQVEKKREGGFWNEEEDAFIRWYSGSSKDDVFEISKDSTETLCHGDDLRHTIHVNVGYDTYGWNVEFANGKVMNLGDVREFQLRKGYLPDTSGRIVYGGLQVAFENIDRITVYESVQYFSYSV